MERRILFAGGQVFTGGGLVPCEVLVRDGRIAAVGTDLDRTGCQVVELGGNILSPGFLDVHTHGGAGVDINAAGQAELEKLSAFFASQGVTGFLASILTDTVEATERATTSAPLWTAPRRGPGAWASTWRGPSSA